MTNLYRRVFFSALVLTFIFSALPAWAATTGYAWSESVGYFDFSGVAVSDAGLSGNAYNDNTGFLVFSGVTNSEGVLSGYAWSESVGYFNFSGVTISDGVFSGSAYNDNTGFLNLAGVETSWRPATDPPDEVPVVEEASSGGSSGGSRKKIGSLVLTIDELLKIIAGLQARIAFLQSINILYSCPNMAFSYIGDCAKLLQIFLNEQGYTVAETGLGSRGEETRRFGLATQSALIKFQSLNGIVPSVGYFGPLTRDFIKSLGY